MVDPMPYVVFVNVLLGLISMGIVAALSIWAVAGERKAPPRTEEAKRPERPELKAAA